MRSGRRRGDRALEGRGQRAPFGMLELISKHQQGDAGTARRGQREPDEQWPRLGRADDAKTEQVKARQRP